MKLQKHRRFKLRLFTEIHMNFVVKHFIVRILLERYWRIGLELLDKEKKIRILQKFLVRNLESI
jgi:hypothetical protein